MIAVDTSALMAIVLKEPESDACKFALAAEDEILISAGTVAEALIVSARRNVGVQMAKIIDELGFEIVTVTPASARRIGQAYEQWGRGMSPAALNFRRLLRLRGGKGTCLPSALCRRRFRKNRYRGRALKTGVGVYVRRRDNAARGRSADDPGKAGADPLSSLVEGAAPRVKPAG